MSLTEIGSLREIARNKKIWDPASWREFLEKDLIPFYVLAYNLETFYKFLGSDKICGKSSLADIEDEILRNKIKVAIYGGVQPGMSYEASFAKFMYDTFGICAENASSFDESIKFYEEWGDAIKITLNKNCWINKLEIQNLVNLLRNSIYDLCSILSIGLTELGIQQNYPYPPMNTVNPIQLLPSIGEKPDRLIDLINKFRQKALELSIGVNLFTTFAFYTRIIPLYVLMEFLGCDIDKIKRLVQFLQLKAISMIDLKEVSLPTQSPEKVLLKHDTYYGAPNPKSYWFGMGLQSYLSRIDEKIPRIFVNMIEHAIKEIHVSFEPWDVYEPFFSYISNLKFQPSQNLIDIYTDIEKGKLVKIRTYPSLKFTKHIPLSDFLLKISPAISSGIIIEVDLYSNSMRISFYPFAKRWFEKVFENGGKT